MNIKLYHAPTRKHVSNVCFNKNEFVLLCGFTICSFSHKIISMLTNTNIHYFKKMNSINIRYFIDSTLTVKHLGCFHFPLSLIAMKCLMHTSLGAFLIISLGKFSSSRIANLKMAMLVALFFFFNSA